MVVIENRGTPFGNPNPPNPKPKPQPPISWGVALTWAPCACCEDRLGTGPPRARTEVIYVDLGYWVISGSITPKGDPASWGINPSVFSPSRVPSTPGPYRHTSPVRKRTPIGPYRRPMPRVLRWS